MNQETNISDGKNKQRRKNISDINNYQNITMLAMMKFQLQRSHH